MLQNPVECTLNRKGQLGVKSLPASIELSVEIESSRKFAKYHCRVPGSGVGTSMARSDFQENPDRRDGIGQEQIFTLTLPVTGQVTGNVIVSARLARPGLRGSIEAIRDMILGTKPNEPSYPISFEILETPSPKGLDQFLHRL